MGRIFGAILLVAAILAAPGARAQQWVELGCKTIGFLIDRDVIEVGERNRRLESLRFSAERNDVEILQVRVFFADGTDQVLEVRSVIRAGTSTRAIDLTGKARNINRIELFYTARRGFTGQARLCAQGRLEAAPPPVQAPLVSGGGREGPVLRGVYTLFFATPGDEGRRVPACGGAATNDDCTRRTAQAYCRARGYAAVAHVAVEVLQNRPYLADLLCRRP